MSAAPVTDADMSHQEVSVWGGASGGGHVFARLVLDRRRGLLWWSVGVGAAVAFVAGFFPSVRDNESFAEITEDLPEGLQSLFGIEPGTLITSAVGYLDARWFATTLPVLLLVYGIGLGAASIAGSEEDGTLELLLANPVSRTRVLFEWVAAMVVLLVFLAVVAAVLLVAVAPLVGLDEGIGVGGLVAATVGVLLLSLVHAALANAIGAATGPVCRSPCAQFFHRTAVRSSTHSSQKVSSVREKC